jgi:hypothetical protein
MHVRRELLQGHWDPQILIPPQDRQRFLVDSPRSNFLELKRRFNCGSFIICYLHKPSVVWIL